MKTQSVSETIAGALFNTGVKVLTYVPGFGANEVFEDFNRLAQLQNPLSFNEEVAYSIAHGAGLAGTRAATLMKSHGFIKAGNSVIDSLYSGTTAGLIAIIFKDSSGRQSDSILNIEAFLDGIGIRYEMLDQDNIYPQLFRLFEQAQKDSLPYALVVDSEGILQSVPTQDDVAHDLACLQYKRDITQHVLCPFFVDYQHNVLNRKNNGQDWRSIPKPIVPRIPDSLPDKWKPVAASYTRLFSVFRSIRGSIVVGDTGVSSLFAFEPFSCIDITTYMGGSVPLAIGAYLGGHRDVWALTGDFSFIAAGHMGLLEAQQREIPLKLLIFYNGKAETTGGQPIPENTLETVLYGYNRYIRFINNPQDCDEIESVLNQANRSETMEIVIADYR